MDFCCSVDKDVATHYLTIIDNKTGKVVYDLFVMVPDETQAACRAATAIEQAIYFNPKCMAPGRSISVYEVKDGTVVL